MDERILEATILALRSVNHIRFFGTERGYQGRFFCALQTALDEQGILGDALILEMEYQKAESRHDTRQRPDIILHIPTEVSGAPVEENNFAVWALKRRASVTEAREDFDKMDEMFELLHYPLGFFVNIDSNSHYLGHYAGSYADRLLAFALRLDDESVSIRQACWVDGQIVEVQP